MRQSPCIAAGGAQGTTVTAEKLARLLQVLYLARDALPIDWIVGEGKTARVEWGHRVLRNSTAGGR